MLDLKFIREHPDQVRRTLEYKRSQADLDRLLELDGKRRELTVRIDDLRSKKNVANNEITRLLKEKQDPKATIASMKSIAAEIDALEPDLKQLESQMDLIIMGIPNVVHESVPQGGPEKNEEVRRWGQPRIFDFTPKTHIELAERLDIIDFKRGAKLSGSNFILYKKAGAQLERALFNFMLDLHTTQHGYSEVFPPVLVNTPSMTGTGQLPKMKDDMYKIEGEDLYLIPTAEVPVTNIFRDETLKEEDLPIYYTAYSACFRKEAGSYGKDTKGLIRVHQFNKVELVKFVTADTSYDELEKLVGNAEAVFQKLNLPYRVLKLAAGDLSFAAAKCYDIEVYTPGLDKWLEASSCSNFEDFQARRAGIRYRTKEKKTQFVHTLNGSGVALPRTVVAILENYQTKEGDVVIPDVLRPYMGGKERIGI